METKSQAETKSQVNKKIEPLETEIKEPDSPNKKSAKVKDDIFNTIKHPSEYFREDFDKLKKVRNDQGKLIPVGFDEWDSL